MVTRDIYIYIYICRYLRVRTNVNPRCVKKTFDLIFSLNLQRCVCTSNEQFVCQRVTQSNVAIIFFFFLCWISCIYISVDFLTNQRIDTLTTNPRYLKHYCQLRAANVPTRVPRTRQTSPLPTEVSTQSFFFLSSDSLLTYVFAQQRASNDCQKNKNLTYTVSCVVVLVSSILRSVALLISFSVLLPPIYHRDLQHCRRFAIYILWERDG